MATVMSRTSNLVCLVVSFRTIVAVGVHMGTCTWASEHGILSWYPSDINSKFRISLLFFLHVWDGSHGSTTSQRVTMTECFWPWLRDRNHNFSVPQTNNRNQWHREIKKLGLVADGGLCGDFLCLKHFILSHIFLKRHNVIFLASIYF